eukprot:XP_001696692.1 predicted protein [Chlamydomonas reinhardtii]
MAGLDSATPGLGGWGSGMPKGTFFGDMSAGGALWSLLHVAAAGRVTVPSQLFTKSQIDCWMRSRWVWDYGTLHMMALRQPGPCPIPSRRTCPAGCCVMSGYAPPTTFPSCVCTMLSCPPSCKHASIRRRLLQRWYLDCSVAVTVEACKEGWPDELLDILPAAFDFLQQHGLINFGVCKAPEAAPAPEPADAGSKDVEMAGGEKEGTAAAGAVKTEAEAGEKQADEAQAAAAAEGAKGEEAEGVSAKPPGKADIVKRLYDVLRTADFETMTEKKIRAQLESDLGVEPGFMNKALGPPHVVVVGGGLAGLAAANVLLRNGLRVTLLEAAERLGGRMAALLPTVCHFLN